MAPPDIVTNIVNRALDKLSRPDLIIGELGEGTEAAKVMLRQYGPARDQLLRAAPWNFARKYAPLSLLADATGQTANVGTVVQAPWVYEYQYPIDCLKFRYVPWNSGNNQQPQPPIMTGLTTIPLPAIRLVPAPYLMSLDYNYPIVTGMAPPWGSQVEWWDTQGTGPDSRSVILTNVQNASAVYTTQVKYPSQWDALFTEALCCYLAAQCPSLIRDQREREITVRRLEAQVKSALDTARAVNGNESGWPQSINREAAWISARNEGLSGNPGWWQGFGGAGGWSGGMNPWAYYSGWDGLSIGASVY